jgi:acyl-CoA synthetase (NDP forming)
MATKKPAETEEQRKAREVVEAIAQSIIDLSAGVRAVLNGKLNKRAIVLLITAAAGRNVTQQQTNDILEAIANLDKSFLK